LFSNTPSSNSAQNLLLLSLFFLLTLKQELSMDTGCPSFIPEPENPPKPSREESFNGPREPSISPLPGQESKKPIAFIGKQFLPLSVTSRIFCPADWTNCSSQLTSSEVTSLRMMASTSATFKSSKPNLRRQKTLHSCSIAQRQVAATHPNRRTDAAPGTTVYLIQKRSILPQFFTSLALTL